MNKEEQHKKDIQGLIEAKREAEYGLYLFKDRRAYGDAHDQPNRNLVRIEETFRRIVAAVDRTNHPDK